MTSPWPMQVFFDGACPICRREAAYWKARDRDGRIQWVDIAAPAFDAEAFGLDRQRVQLFMHVRTADGQVSTGLCGAVKIWEALPPGLLSTPLRWLFKVPGVLPFASIFYRIFARNRYRLTGRCTPESC